MRGSPLYVEAGVPKIRQVGSHTSRPNPPYHIPTIYIEIILFSSEQYLIPLDRLMHIAYPLRYYHSILVKILFLQHFLER